MTGMWGWGRYPIVDAEVVRASSAEGVRAALAGGPLTPRGLGRSYGDSSLGERMLDVTGLDHLLAFDPETGTVTCEAGVSLAELIRVFLPRGWFLPVTPGTKYVTVGGAIASDVHGKNHHSEGAFSDHVDSLRIMVASGEVLDVSRTSHPELFHATCGGMGLTGVILEATVRLKKVGSRHIVEQLVKAPDLDAAIAAFDAHHDVTYSVAWIDLTASGKALGRSHVMSGEHADDGVLTPVGNSHLATVPLDAPGFLMNKATVKAFNSLYYARVLKDEVTHTVDFEPYFYPLDKVHDWNRLLGRSGFTQYQFVIPLDATEVLRDIVARVAKAGLASPIAVLKTFGEGNDNLLSFPTAGWTLALDFQVGAKALALCDELDEIVLAQGGRLYLTKDARMSADTFHASYPRLAEFEAVRAKYGATGVFTSAQSKRLGLS